MRLPRCWNHLDNRLFRHLAFEEQGNRFGDRPSILTQQTFPQQPEMFVAPPVAGISELNPDLTLTDVNRKRLKIVTFIVETSSTLQIEAAAVPVAGENAVPDRPASG
jgi:hypothetical protein